VVVLSLIASLGRANGSTPRSFAASMNTICRVGTERANLIGQVTSLDDLVLLGPRLVAVDDWELSHFLKLGLPPRSIAKHVARYISAQRQLNTLGRKAVAAARRGEAGSAVRLSQKSAVFVRIQETEGRRIGARACLPSAGAR
jgi:hypothetical protein